MKSKKMQAAREWCLITLCAVMQAVGVYFFKFPYHFCTGSTSGLAVLLGAWFPNLSAGTFMLILNIALIILGFLCLGKEFGIKTVYVSVLDTLLVYLFERIYPFGDLPGKHPLLTDNPLLALLVSTALIAVTSGMLIDLHASCGGTEIIAVIIRKYSGLNISKALLISDLLIAGATFFTFSFEVGLYSMLGFVAKSYFVGTTIKRLHLSKYCTVILDPRYEQQVLDYIRDELHKSATVSTSYTGAYQNDEKCVLLVALSESQAAQLREFVGALDEKAFMIATDTSEVAGRGFRGAF